MKNTIKKLRTGVLVSIAGAAFMSTGVLAEEVQTTATTQPDTVVNTESQEVVPQSAIDAGYTSSTEVSQAIEQVDNSIASVDQQLAQPDYRAEQVITDTTQRDLALHQLTQEQTTVQAEIPRVEEIVAQNSETLASANQAKDVAQQAFDNSAKAVEDATVAVRQAEEQAVLESQTQRDELIAQAEQEVETAKKAYDDAVAQASTQTRTVEFTESISERYDEGNSKLAPVPYADVTNTFYIGQMSTNTQGENFSVFRVDENGDPYQRTLLTVGEVMGYIIPRYTPNVGKYDGDFAGTYAQSRVEYNKKDPKYLELLEVVKKRASTTTVAQFFGHAGNVEDKVSREVVAITPRYMTLEDGIKVERSVEIAVADALADLIAENNNLGYNYGHTETLLTTPLDKFYVVPYLHADGDYYRFIMSYFYKGDGIVSPTAEFTTSTDENGKLQAYVNGEKLVGLPMFKTNRSTEVALSESERNALVQTEALALADARNNLGLVTSQGVTPNNATVRAAMDKLVIEQGKHAENDTALKQAINTAAIAERNLTNAQTQLEELKARLVAIDERIKEVQANEGRTQVIPAVDGLTADERAKLEQERADLVAERTRLVAILSEFGISAPVLEEVKLVEETTPVADNGTTGSESKDTSSSVVDDTLSEEQATKTDENTSEIVSDEAKQDGGVVATEDAKKASEGAKNTLVAPLVERGTSQRQGLVATTAQLASKLVATTNKDAVSPTETTRQATLPNTNDSASVVGILGSLLSTVGLVGLVRKKK